MSRKEQILNILDKETNVCKRLCTLIPETMFNYKPYEGMRTTLELLQYMSWCSGSCIESYVERDEEVRKGIYGKNEVYGELMKPGEFLSRKDEQMEKMRSLLNNVTDDDMLTK